ncbi:C-reactive protein 3.3-like [Penaeus monodon]|uniref:C-reactive protein 3.3-like n=1 Tax=Penaeus monodon TaxID=6687 RepID=UPI0018A7B256|nr:C-reactive protein 3.3-like [Penaeus monodon]
MTPSAASYGILKSSIREDLNAFTLCYRIKPYFFRPEVIVLSYVVAKDDIFRTDHNRRGMQLMMALQRLRQVTEAVTPLMFWSAWCYGVDSATGEWKIYMNGEKIADGRWLPVSKVRSAWASNRNSNNFTTPSNRAERKRKNSYSIQVVLPKNGTLVIGQDQDTEGSGFDATQSFCGEFTGLEIFDRMLDEFDLKDLSSCESVLGGNILTWDEAVWDVGADSAEVRQVDR